MQAIEQSAAEVFRGSSQAAIADDANSPVEFYIPFQMDDLVLVADQDGSLCGFAACQTCLDALHLWELAVRHVAQGHGVGTSLVGAVVALARRRRQPAITLSTFRDIAWNAPFYRRMGFVELAPSELNRRLAAVVAREAGLGLDVANRCAMRLVL